MGELGHFGSAEQESVLTGYLGCDVARRNDPKLPYILLCHTSPLREVLQIILRLLLGFLGATQPSCQGQSSPCQASHLPNGPRNHVFPGETEHIGQARLSRGRRGFRRCRGGLNSERDGPGRRLIAERWPAPGANCHVSLVRSALLGQKVLTPGSSQPPARPCLEAGGSQEEERRDQELQADAARSKYHGFSKSHGRSRAEKLVRSGSDA
mmetsp:Transcript_64204/g.139673  ORF Transcript_64204/g.139673 Transcript_64204/m.139673 type:complete len:210 (-) Transcript_64204:11-640(-)